MEGVVPTKHSYWATWWWSLHIGSLIFTQYRSVTDGSICLSVYSGFVCLFATRCNNCLAVCSYMLRMFGGQTIHRSDTGIVFVYTATSGELFLLRADTMCCRVFHNFHCLMSDMWNRAAVLYYRCKTCAYVLCFSVCISVTVCCVWLPAAVLSLSRLVCMCVMCDAWFIEDWCRSESTTYCQWHGNMWTACCHLWRHLVSVFVTYLFVFFYFIIYYYARWQPDIVIHNSNIHTTQLYTN